MFQTAPNIDILLICYNHQQYIRNAVESIMQQDYKGGIRVIVADDCSTDATVDIIKSLAAEQDRIEFAFLPNRANLGITRNYERAFRNCKAEYTAVLEGDDYWASTRKLTKQVEFLEEHRKCVACSCNYYVYCEERHDYKLRVPQSNGYLILSSRILIHDNLIGNFSTCTYRTAALQALPEILFAHTSYDWITNICVAMQGPIGFLNEPLSVYRVHSNGTWNTLSLKSKKQAQFDIIPVYNEITGRVFCEDFEVLRRSLSEELADLTGARPSTRIKSFVARVCPPPLLPIARQIYRGLTSNKSIDRLEKLEPVRQEPT